MNDSANTPFTEDMVTLEADLLNIRSRITTNPLQTQEDFRQVFNDLSLLQFMMIPRVGWIQAETPQIPVHKCEECQVAGSLYRIAERWLCIDHVPKGTLAPVGCHGEDYRRYREK